MSAGPPESDESRSAEAAQALPGVDGGAASAVVPEGVPGAVTEAVTEAVTVGVGAAVPASATSGLPWLEAELAASGDDARRAARLLHEIAHTTEATPGREKDAAKVYAQSLTADPTLAANAWALKRFFRTRGMWENLLRLLEAETRFAILPTPMDRADLQVEKGRLLEDRLARDAEARAAYEAAIELAPGHPSALLSLWLLGLRTGERALAASALQGLVGGVEDPEARAALLLEATRLGHPELREATPDQKKALIDGLLKLLLPSDLPDLGAEAILDELDRVSLTSDDADLRMRVLDVFDSRLARPGVLELVGQARAVALLREKARRLQKRGTREAALAVLERALRLAPRHPLLVADVLDLAEDAGKYEVMANAVAGAADLARSEGPESAPGDEARRSTDEALLRVAETAARVGAHDAARAALARIPAASPVALLASFARIRVLGQLGQGDELAAAWAEQARTLLHVGGEVLGLDAAATRAEACHLLVRAAVVSEEHAQASGQDAPNDAGSGQAEALLREALVVEPGYPPAVDRLRALLASGERWLELADVLEGEHARAVGERKAALTQALRVLHRDVLGDPRKAARLFPYEAGSHQAQAIETLVLEADARGGALVASEVAEPAARQEAVESAARAFETLATRLGEGPAAAGALVLAARLLDSAGQASHREALLRKATQLDPGSGASAMLERAGGTTAAEVVGRELAAVEAGDAKGSKDIARALRFRLAFLAYEARRPADALAQLEPLRRAGDIFALAWSLDLARDSNDGALEAAVLRDFDALEAATAESVEATPTPAARIMTRFEQLRLLGEAQERAGDLTSAQQTYARVIEVSLGVAPAVVLDAGLGLLRTRAASDGPAASVARTVERMASALDVGPEREGVAQAASWLGVFADAAAQSPASPTSSASPAPSASPGPDPVATWLWATRAGDASRATSALVELAQSATAGPGGPELQALGAVRATLATLPSATESVDAALSRARGSEAAPLLGLVATDLVTEDPANSFAALDGCRQERIDRLVADGPASRELALRLLCEQGRSAEERGRARAAAGAYARVLAVQPDSIEATEGLRRVVAGLGDRRLQAALLVRLGRLLGDPKRAAARFAEAALLLEEEGDEDAAARQFLAVLERVPEDDEAYLRLHRILEKQRRIGELEKLLGFKIAHAQRPEEIAELYVERATLRRDHLDRRREAIEDLRRALVLRPQSVSILRALAVLAVREGRFSVAADLLERALPLEPEAGPANEIRVELGVALAAAGAKQRAHETLLAAVDAAPDDPGPRERLIEVALRHEEHELAATQLLTLEARTAAPAAKATHRLRLARLERDQRRNNRGAVDSFVRALELDPLGEAATELERIVPSLLRLTTDEEVTVRRVYAGCLAELQAIPLEPRRLANVRAIAALLGETVVAEASGQLASAVGLHGSMSERRRVQDLGRPLSRAALEALFAEDDRRACSLALELWPLVASGAARVEAPDPGDLGATRATRVTPGREPRLAWMESAARALGLAELTVHVLARDEMAATPLDHPEPALLLARGVVGGDAEARFLVGRALFLLWARASGLLRWSPETVDRIWQAVTILIEAPGAPSIDTAGMKAIVKAVDKGLSRKETKALVAAAPRFAREPRDPGAWRRAVLAAAHRFALLLAGDLGAAVRVLTQEARPSIEALRRPDVASLVSFALSPGYDTLRREAGVTAHG